VLAWGPLRWHAGAFASAGHITGVPLQWLELATGQSLASAGVAGDLVFDGAWDATLDQTLRLTAQVARASGDLTLPATDAAPGAPPRMAAGLRQARLTLSSQGRAISAELTWDSARAGNVHAALRTELATTDEPGRIHWIWPGSAPLQGQVQASLPRMAVWSRLAPPGWRLRGALSADAHIDGTRAAPAVSGTLQADDLALRSVVDGIELAGGRLRARIDGTRLLIDEFTLHGAGDAASGGLLRASGQAGWIDGRAQASLTASLEQLRASIHPERQITVSGQVQATLDGRALHAEGSLRADPARIVLPEPSAPSLGSDVNVRGPGSPDASAQLPPEDAQAAPYTATAQVQLDLGENFRVQGQGIDTRLAGVLTLTANGPVTALPRLTGSVRAVDGSFRAYGQQLDIERGNIVFTGEAANPTLDIIALRPNYTSSQLIGAQVMGTALLPRVRLYSDPALPDSQTLAWLLLGRPAPSTGAESAMLQAAALAVLGGREGRGLAGAFGLDELSVASGDAATLTDASVTLGKRLSDRLYVSYQHSLAGATGALFVFYALSQRWTLRSQAGENSAVDLIYTLAFD
jgi:translocation and assembly module TamB